MTHAALSTNERDKVPEKSPSGPKHQPATSILDSENVFIEDTLANKYKENPRE